MFGLFGKKNNDRKGSGPESSAGGIFIQNGPEAEFKYEVHFHDLTTDQIDYLISHFKDNDWDEGLAISECSVSTDGDVTKFKFSSKKRFCVKDSEEWNDDDIDNNIYTKLVGKGQFFSAIYFSSDIDVDTANVTLLDPDGALWCVELDKYPEFTAAG